MDIELNELMNGQATAIKGKTYFPTAGYVEPFLDRVQRLTNDIRVHVQLPDQITSIDDRDNITYNRVYIEAVMPDELCFSNHDKVIGMVYGLDVRKPVAKFYNGAMNSACTNLCVFSPEYLSCQAIEPEMALDYKPLDNILLLKDNTKETLQKLYDTKIENTEENRRQLLGRWMDNVIMGDSYDNGFQPVRLSVDNTVQAYKSLFLKDDSEYYQQMDMMNMFDIYNAFTQQITNARDRGKDIMNIFEKTLLLRRILEF